MQEVSRGINIDEINEKKRQGAIAQYRQMLKEVNAYRTRKGKAEYKTNQAANKLAQYGRVGGKW